MAPLKREFDLITDDVFGYDFESNPVEISLIDSFCSPSSSKKFKLSATTANPKVSLSANCLPSLSNSAALKNDLSSYLDLNPDYDAVVPSANDLVAKSEAWLSDSIPGSPISVFHELPESDSDSDSANAMKLGLEFDTTPLGSPTTDFGDLGMSLLTADVVDPSIATNHLFMNVSDAVAPLLESKPKVTPPVTTITDPVTTASVAAAAQQPKSSTKIVATSTASTTKKALATTRPYDGSNVSNFTPTMTEESKTMSSRWAHNSTERKRRCEIRRLFSGLRDLFPDLQGDDRTSNINTLNRAIACVSELTRKQVELEAALRHQRDRNTMLKSRKLKTQRSRLQQPTTQRAVQSTTITTAATAAAKMNGSTTKVTAVATSSKPMSVSTSTTSATTRVGALNPIPTYPKVTTYSTTTTTMTYKAPFTVKKPTVVTPSTTNSVNTLQSASILSRTKPSTVVPASYAKTYQPVLTPKSSTLPKSTVAPVRRIVTTSSPLTTSTVAVKPTVAVNVKSTVATKPTVSVGVKSSLPMNVKSSLPMNVKSYTPVGIKTTTTSTAIKSATSLTPTLKSNTDLPRATPILKSVAPTPLVSTMVTSTPETKPIIANMDKKTKPLPSALRQLLDHNSRGVNESQPLPPRRKIVRKF